MKGRRVRMKKLTRVALALFLLCCASWATATRTTIATAVAQKVAVREAPAQKATFPAEWRAALERISADSMRGHLSFLSSDLLEGRKTPSRGLDIAAEYIAAQFRRAGLEPAGDDGYFQTANWSLASRDMSAFQLSFAGGGGSLNVNPEQASLGFSVAGFNFWTPEDSLALKDAGVVKVDFKNSSALTREQAAGKVVTTELPEFPRGDRARAFQVLREENDFLARVRSLGVPLVVAFDRTPPRGGRTTASSRLVDPDSNERESPLGPEPTAPLVIVRGPEPARVFDSLPAGAGSETLTFRAPAIVQTPVRVRNVAAILRGSDPALKDTYVIVSAHYDHLGVREPCDSKREDCVYNGANDDGSGTVGVVEMASALARLNPRPRRSVLFITFFGEELGLLGSRYYGRHPLVPLSKTVAQLNLEQIGRTDDSEGPQVGTLAVTGFDYSDVGATLEQAGETVGVKVYKHPTNSDAFFSRSDNQSLADAGVPAHTLSVAYEFSDYHAVGDEWPKVDFANMERVVRAAALAALLIADNTQEPRWNEQNPRAAQYVEAWKKLHGR
ncbi:MAG: aminopeptidase [Acidobacteria bacterium]|nr:MAG: aminopeptidase [Acidobacteriota bacterium]